MASALKNRASCGLLWPIAAELAVAVQVSTQSGFDFMATPLVHPRYRQDEDIYDASASSFGGGGGAGTDEAIVATKAPRGYPFTRSDMLLNSADWSSLVVGIISRDANLESSVAAIRRRAEVRIQRELTFAAHLGLSAILIPINKSRNANLARLMYSCCMNKTTTMQIWARVPINAPTSLVQPLSDEDPWEWWDVFRNVANSEKRLSLALELGAEPPTEARLKRWLGEPVKALIISTRLFLTNKRGYPVLSRQLQVLIRQFLPLDPQCIIDGRARGHDFRFYQQYLDHLWQQQMDGGDVIKQYARGYEDFLQSPLQPLMDNLESGTYEVFEKDPIKYTEYERAIWHAIVDKVPDESKDSAAPLIVMVLGAGRGPLVRAALRAADMAARRIRVFAVEKNPNAVVTLLTQKNQEWRDRVEVIATDMRDWHPRECDKADIVISELLGSFGDNELSPECLYPAQRVMKSDGVSIPASYTSFVVPLQSSKLYNEVRNSYDRDKNPHANFETPYVVHFQNRTELSEPQALFTFEHPIKGPIDNSRYGIKTFEISLSSELHGFGGYFECTLYKDIMISINPKTHSKGMFSWFPIFFPLRTPVKLLKGNEVELHFWRLNNGKQVWYEWCITKPVGVAIHNPSGRSYTIGL